MFIDELYPNLPDRLAALGGAIRVSLQVDGPGASYPTLELSRKITKRGSKNYRLNGEFLSNPKEAVGRFAGSKRRHPLCLRATRDSAVLLRRERGSGCVVLGVDVVGVIMSA